MSISFESQLELPVGFTEATTPLLSSEQVGVLYFPRNQHFAARHSLVGGYEHLAAMDAERGVATEYIGVADPEGKVVGVAGLSTSETEAELSCLAVLPDHRGQGIGKWLIAERLRRADERGISSVYVEALSDTNTLASYYTELGFVLSGDNASVQIFRPRQRASAKAHLVLKL